MNDYYEARVDLDPCTEDATDYVAALLGDIGYESFVPDLSGVSAYIKAADYDEAAVNDVLSDFPFDCVIKVSAKLIPGQDWNQEWEKNYFKPIVIGDQCAIHSSFHTDIPPVKYDIVIDPKMAFGTGHHATTSLILGQLLESDLEGKSLIDMGTGTGILAILAAMRGADPVFGIEIDEFAYVNAVDNIKSNGQPQITLINSDASGLTGLPKTDYFVANINRNVITADLPFYIEHLKPGGVMLLSGFYEADIPVVMATAAPLGLVEVWHGVKGDGWTCLRLQYKP